MNNVSAATSRCRAEADRTEPHATLAMADRMSADAAPVGAGGAPVAAARAPAPPRSRILVVDDEPLVGTVLARTLGAEHDIVACNGVREALRRLALGERFDLVFSDLLMPELTGMDLHAELWRAHPDLARRMVFLTGGACTEAAREFLARPGMVWLEKPFDLESIRAVIARRLAPAAVASAA